MKFLAILLGIIFSLCACQNKPENNMITFFLDGNEYTYLIKYGEVIQESEVYNFHYLSEYDNEDIEIFMTISKQGNGSYTTVDLADENLFERVENEKILIFTLSVKNKNPQINGSYYSIDNEFQVTKVSDSYQIFTPYPIHLIDEENPNRKIKMELQIINLPLKDMT